MRGHNAHHTVLSDAVPKVGVLTHELGHILGLVHEEVRYPEHKQTKEEEGYHTIPSADPRTASVIRFPQWDRPDPASVMRSIMPESGDLNPDLKLTPMDKAFASALYGLPDPVPPIQVAMDDS